MDITPKLMKRIYAVARQKGIDNETLHELVYREVSKESIKTLTCTEAYTVIHALEPGGSAVRQERKGMITDKQYNMIVRMSYILGWEGNKKRINGFVKKYTGVENVKWLTKYQASNVIEGLKKLEEKM